MSFESALQRHMQTFNRMPEIQADMQTLADQVAATFTAGGKLLFMGNGGSAADSQHLAAEFVVRYKAERRALPAIALTVDSSILTAHSNDYSFDSVFTRQIEALCQPKDLVIGLSTSGNSANVINAIEAAQKIGATCWAWTGESGGQLDTIADHLIKAPSSETARIQEAHIFVGHWLCEEMDRLLSTD
ncbi:D-sedoheptulose 7-phosphate isomerase [Amphritea sp. 2_MG-2023]|jgi:D-sedoheptulose 7-phosphate isomerase|uniref:D-sedoheptulose-7-phosphate isomerase n=1 Tax=Amphritea TaxID=515417 RepID=UPI001C07DB07|nr:MULTISPECIES: D-sedoheptulose 7-phosphate isomerase [Amphritea]MBU2965635.1 D-sedoheptulose 7-phosphate isomerase [Amphritea atlantica]MDO6417191.1 D-sedoheptulose 7-phosphate isomerase [Amphritea sp. 2_MG-2023]MDX2421588.1 D-sedoheptulose 7-phosphate isomerase [Amphritea sp.]